jgi:hypothetical protein
MSAFVVADETINRVVSSLHRRILEGFSPSELGVTEILQAGFNLVTREGSRQLAEEMFALNVAAVNARYGEGEAEKFRALDFEFAITIASPVQVIKSLESWLYQCTEGNLPFTRIYQTMKDVLFALCIDFVHQTKEYTEGSENER